MGAAQDGFVLFVGRSAIHAMSLGNMHKGTKCSP